MSDDKVKSSYPPLSSFQFDRKRFQKELKSQFQTAKNFSKFRITKLDKQFDKFSKVINNSLITILTDESTFSYGNFYFILTIINNHCMFLNSEMGKIKGNVISKETLDQIQECILDQHEAISETLVDNIKNPISYDTLPTALGLDLETPEVEIVE